jgi:hypothetical protein
VVLISLTGDGMLEGDDDDDDDGDDMTFAPSVLDDDDDGDDMTFAPSVLDDVFTFGDDVCAFACSNKYICTNPSPNANINTIVIQHNVFFINCHLPSSVT